MVPHLQSCKTIDAETSKYLQDFVPTEAGSARENLKLMTKWDFKAYSGDMAEIVDRVCCLSLESFDNGEKLISWAKNAQDCPRFLFNTVKNARKKGWAVTDQDFAECAVLETTMERIRAICENSAIFSTGGAVPDKEDVQGWKDHLEKDAKLGICETRMVQKGYLPGEFSLRDFVRFCWVLLLI